MNDDDAWAKVRSARVGRLATVTPSNLPHVVPFVFVLIERDLDHTVYWAVDHKPKRSPELQRIRNLRMNPVVAFVVDAYDDDWSRLWWVRCSGPAREVDDAIERVAALDALSSKYRRYVAEPPDGPVVAIDVDHISWWQATPDPGS
jgi:PPOX class probable F420-dependent enzyme